MSCFCSEHKGNNLSALHRCFRQGRVWRGVSTRQKFSVPPLWPVSSLAVQTWLSTLPAHLGGQSITQRSRCGDTIFCSDGFSCCTCTTCSSLLLSYWNELVHLHTSHSSLLLSVTLWVSVCITKSKLYIKDITVWAATRWQPLDFRPAVCPRDLPISVCILFFFFFFLEVLCIFLLCR